jgi:hypothetical protein
MYKVFYLSKEIIFIQSKKEIIVSCSDVTINSKKKDVLSKAYQAFISSEKNGRLVFLCGENVNMVFEKFIALFICIEAAGGLVTNEKEALLMIFRMGKWDLPKGKIEKDESPETAALREVEEETGMSSLRIIEDLDPTFHIYYVNNEKFLKTTFWYKMDCLDHRMPTPQIEEGITTVKWLDKVGVNEAINNTYDSLKGLLEQYLEI